MASSPRILLVAGARPNFMKIAPIIRAMKAHGGFAWRLVHTGQHYDYEMSEAFFKDLEIPEPDHTKLSCTYELNSCGKCALPAAAWFSRRLVLVEGCDAGDDR